ncbi:MAG: hypothetical protein JRJ85_01460 [Deltaproteobacteria bacterium]|nr:hypothetical protein [Deltaproteobacteria bacterium]
MGEGIIKIRDKYLAWSTIWDKPITPGMTLEELKEYIKEKYGEEGLLKLPARLERVAMYGTSFICDKDLEGTIFLNRAGEDETQITADEIYRRYCIPR